jgi:flagellar basal-body rod protein FlgB
MVQPRAVLFDLISARAAWLGQRQAVLGQNVANADTPGYRPRDLEPAGFAGLLRQAGGQSARLQPACTAPLHQAVAGPEPGAFRDRPDREFEATPSGNGVQLPDQMRKMATTELDHQLTTGLYRRYVGMVRTAIGIPQG